MMHIKGKPAERGVYTGCQSRGKPLSRLDGPNGSEDAIMGVSGPWERPSNDLNGRGADRI